MNFWTGEEEPFEKCFGSLIFLRFVFLRKEPTYILLHFFLSASKFEGHNADTVPLTAHFSCVPWPAGAAAFGLKRVICAPDVFAEAAGLDLFPAKLPVALFVHHLCAAPLRPISA